MTAKVKSSKSGKTKIRRHTSRRLALYAASLLIFYFSHDTCFYTGTEA